MNKEIKNNYILSCLCTIKDKNEKIKSKEIDLANIFSFDDKNKAIVVGFRDHLARINKQIHNLNLESKDKYKIWCNIGKKVIQVYKNDEKYIEYSNYNVKEGKVIKGGN